MASAVTAKPVLNNVKIKRPPQSLNSNATKPTNPISSPSVASKRLPGQKGPPPTPTSATNGATTNAARPNKAKKDPSRSGDPSRLNRPSLRNGVSEINTRAVRKVSGPLVTKEEYILKKFKGQTPSLIIHLHPTYFRFDQQDGSFSYQSEMRFIIEHLQKRTVPHDILDELKKSNVQFFDGWLIVRVVDHKTASADTNSSSTTTTDDESLFSIHNYNPYITPSSWAPYPTKDQPISEQSKEKSPSVKKENVEANAGADKSTESSADGKGEGSRDGSKTNPPEPRVYHVALRPTPLSQHQDIVIDSMTPDPKSLNRKQPQTTSRTPGQSGAAPPTPLSAVPSTPIAERGPNIKKQKMKIEPKDLLDYEARIINATAPALYLEPVSSLEDVDRLMEILKDPFHEEDPPSPRGRKRTVAELAADEAIAKEEERFMLIMDERLSSGVGGVGGANSTGGDGQAGTSLFQPRFEKFNALENIKAQHKENKRLEHEKKVQQDHLRRVQQEAMEEQKRQQRELEAARNRELQARQMMQSRAEMAARQQAAAQQAQHMPQVNGVMPGIQHQQQALMQASQAQRSSPIVRANSPNMNSSPVVGNMSQPGHSVPMGVTSSNQGAGSPARPGSAVQHAHPGVQMVRNVSQQGMSRQSTPQMPQATPSIRQATPVMRTATPGQRMTNSSPHPGMMAPTPQLAHTGVMATPQMNAAQMSAQQAMIQQRQQQMIQQQQQLQAQGHQINNPDFAHFQAQQHALQQQQRLAQQQQMMQAAAAQQGQHQQSPQNPNQFANQQQAAYQAQVAEMMKQQMAHAAQRGQTIGQNPQGQGSPQHPGMMQMQRPQTANVQQQGGATNSLIQQRFQHHRTIYLKQVAQQFGGNPNMIPTQQLDVINQRAKQQANRDVHVMVAQRNQMQVQNQMAMQQGMQQQQQQQQQQNPHAAAQHQQMMNQQMQAQMMAQLQAQQRGQMGGGQ